MGFIGEFAALSAAFFWSFSAHIFTFAGRRINALQLNIDRLFFASILIAVTIPVFGISWHISWTQIYYLSVSGFIGLVLGDTFLFKSFAQIGPRITMLIMSISPAMAAVFAWLFLGENLSLWGILGMAVTLTGIAIVVMQSRGGESERQAKEYLHVRGRRVSKSMIGAGWAFLGALGQAGGLIFAKFAFVEGPVHSFTATLVRLLSSFVMLLPMAIILKRYGNPFKIYKADKKALGLVFAASIIGPYLGITASLFAIIYAQVGIASTLMSVTPILMLPISYFWLKEKLNFYSYAGAFIAVAGIAMLFLT
ncbi:MAG: DMT family transporter [Chloroflexota bacterium]